MCKSYDINEIKEQVKKVLDYFDSEDYKVDSLIDTWHEKKAKFIKKFGGLIFESPTFVTTEKADEDKIIEYHDFISDILFYYKDLELKNFLLNQGWTSFYENKVSCKCTLNNGKVIPEGMKINKALKYFIEDKSELENWQNKYSQLIQNVKVSGRLCLSVHPLDFLSISETTHSWRSCHALDGEYRAGNLSYMNDSSTVIAYLKSEGNEYKLPHFPKEVLWNSKKWRTLFYVSQDEDLIFSSKPYPFDNKYLVNISYELLQERIGGAWPQAFTQVNSPDDVLRYIEDAIGSVHFNDCICSSTYNPRYKVILGKELADCRPVEVGSPVKCLKCEKEYLEFNSDYRCCDCGNYIVCDCCGVSMYQDERCYLDGQSLCPSCYDEQAMWCHECDAVHSTESGELIYDEIDEEWYCSSCHSEIMAERIVENFKEVG